MEDTMPNRLETLFANRFVQRVLHKTALAAALLLSLLWALAQAAWPTGAAPASGPAWEWPTTWEGRPLRPLAAGPVEQRFARQFPGEIVRMSVARPPEEARSAGEAEGRPVFDGQRVLVLRHATAPTRMLHPAEDCYRGLGYRIADTRLEQDAQQRLWRCFIARRAGGAPLRVCERTTDAQGQAFTDTSAWYWAAVAGRSTGPWLAVTTVALAPETP